jgi:hypothetical protein
MNTIEQMLANAKPEDVAVIAAEIRKRNDEQARQDAALAENQRLVKLAQKPTPRPPQQESEQVDLELLAKGKLKLAAVQKDYQEKLEKLNAEKQERMAKALLAIENILSDLGIDNDKKAFAISTLKNQIPYNEVR